jgi:hypothetical protein
MKAAIADAKEPAKKQKLLHHSPESPNPCRHMDDRRTISAILRHEQVVQPMKIKCGSGLARESGGSVNTFIN